MKVHQPQCKMATSFSVLAQAQIPWSLNSCLSEPVNRALMCNALSLQQSEDCESHHMRSATHLCPAKQLESSSSCYLLPEYHSFDRLGNACDSVAHASEQHCIHHMHKEVVEACIDRQHGPDHHYNHCRRRRPRSPDECIELVLHVAQNTSFMLHTS